MVEPPGAVRVRYSYPDGSAGPPVRADTLFEGLADLLARADDVEEVLQALKRSGTRLEDGEVKGLESLAEKARERIRQRCQEFNLRRSLDEIEEKLQELLKRARRMMPAGSGEATSAEKPAQGRPERLSQRLAEALSRLGEQSLGDGEAEALRELLARERNNVRDLETFRERHGDLFRGPTDADYRKALELMREVQALKALEQALASGEMERISADQVEKLLGPEARRALERLEEALKALDEGGYLTRQGAGVRLSPKAVRRLGELALRDIFQGLLRGRPGAHCTAERGAGELRFDASRDYVYGEAWNLDLVATLKRALSRRPGVPVGLAPQDFAVYESDYGTSTSTVLCLDMSWSMSWEGRFGAAKRVTLALETLIRTRFPRDFFSVVGFFTRAVELRLSDLPHASWNVGDPFTNLQEGLKLASRILRRQRARNQHIIVVTDGQPTAYLRDNRVHCEWPLSLGGISPRAAEETLKEVERVTRQGIIINTFMLDDSSELRAFVEKMTRLNRGRALYTRPENLGQYLLVDYVARRQGRI